MNIKEKDLLSQFSAYAKAAVKHTRQEYLEKRSKIRNHETPLFEEDEYETTDETDILQQVDRMSDHPEKGNFEIRLLLEQIDNSVLFRAVENLTREQKEILMLRIFYMKTFREIGDMLGMPARKAENTYFNTIKKIRRTIGGGKDGI